MTASGPHHHFAQAGEDAVLYEPLDRLVDRIDDQLQRDELFQRASKSGLYREKWRAAGVHPERLGSREDLRQLPCLSGSDLIGASASSRSLRDSLLVNPRIWITSRGSSEDGKKWLPLTLGDVVHWFGRVRRLNDLLAAHAPRSEPTLVLALNEPMPRASNAVPYLLERVDYLAGGQQFEFIIAAMQMLWRNRWDAFVLKKLPQWLMASVADARSLAGELGARVQELHPRLQLGLFWGEPLDGTNMARAELVKTYGLAHAYSVYFSAECREMYVECRQQDGLHLWMDGMIHEVMTCDPQAWDQSGAWVPGPGDSVFVDQAEPGIEGEYVITTFAESLPLIRYRTGDRIRVVDTKPCACGITHPRVEFLGRQEVNEAGDQ